MTIREMQLPGKFDFPGNLTSRENLNFREVSINQFMQSFISREMRISVKFDFQGKFEFPGKFKFPGNVTKPVYAAIYLPGNEKSREM